MPTVERSVLINAPPEKVYEAFVDLGGWLKWNPHMREVRPLAEGPLAVGSKARVSLKLNPFASVWEVTTLSPGRSFAWASRLPGIRLAFDHLAEPADGGTKATLRIEIQGPLAFGAGLFGAVYSRNLGHSLKALKDLLEGERPAEAAAPPPPPEPAPEAEAAEEAPPAAEAAEEAPPAAEAAVGEAEPEAGEEPPAEPEHEEPKNE